MLYSEFIVKAEKETIHQLENGVWYLEPEWIDLISRYVESDLTSLTDSYLDSWYDVEDILKLEVERRNAQDSRKTEVINWIYDTITATVEPAILQEETDYIKQVVEFMKANHEGEQYVGENEG